MADSYVCSKAKIKCTCGDKISTLTVFPERTIWLTGEPQANISDHIPLRNIAPFGKCHTTAYPATGAATAANHGKLTPMPCLPNTPFPWMGGKNDVILQGQPALLKSSTCRCVWGGTISFTFDGQSEGTGKDLDKENSQTQEELDSIADEPLSPEELLDALQMALDAAGMFPGLGAIPDLLNACISACRGDWGNAGLCLLAAVPLIGDAAGAVKLLKNTAKVSQKTKKVQKIGSHTDDLAAARARREARLQREKLVEQGVAEGKVVNFEKKQTVVIRREATTGRPIETMQPSSVSRTETTRASSINPYEKVTPASSAKSTGSSTSYGAGNGGKGSGGGSGRNPKPKDESIFKGQDLGPKDNVANMDEFRKAKGYDEVMEKIKDGEKRPDMGI